MTPLDDDAFLEFASDTSSEPAGRNEPETQAGVDEPYRHRADGEVNAALEEALVDFSLDTDTHAVPPPVQSEIDALVDAVSAGGRPRIANEPDVIAEADDWGLEGFALKPY